MAPPAMADFTFDGALMMASCNTSPALSRASPVALAALVAAPASLSATPSVARTGAGATDTSRTSLTPGVEGVPKDGLEGGACCHFPPLAIGGTRELGKLPPDACHETSGEDMWWLAARVCLQTTRSLRLDEVGSPPGRDTRVYLGACGRMGIRVSDGWKERGRVGGMSVAGRCVRIRGPHNWEPPPQPLAQ